ncbi:MAG: NAD-dependent epimerase/dehydratase family protein [Bacilli bacterium]
MKHVLLIGGGGTLGTYTAKELLTKGHRVDVICLEEKQSDNKKITFIRAKVTLEYLTNFLADKHYDGIIDFLWYKTLEEYIPYHELLTKHTNHLIFLSSYRIYADEEHPITENAPRLLEIVKDAEFLATEKYALTKARCEDFIRSYTPFTNWTIVRPVISFSVIRFDLHMYSGTTVIEYAREGKTLMMPEKARNLIAGLDWAGNTGRLIALLLFNKKAIGEAFNVSSAPGLTWGDISKIYTKLIGLKIEWVDEDTYLNHNPAYPFKPDDYRYIYDRKYNRAIDNRKILDVIGMKKEDFVSLEEGLIIELARLEN